MPNIPYKGLNPYSEKDAKLFFGRETQIENIIDRLTTSRLTILYGESGVGKTSVVRAGVAAQLRQQAQENLTEYKVPVHGVVVFPPFNLSWKDEPLPQLKKQIEEDIRELAPNIQPPEPELPFIKTLQAWTELLGGEEGDGELFIILDQFEEYFLYHHSSEAEEGTFAFEFPRAVTRSGLWVNFLLSMRKDSLAELDYFKGRLLNLLGNRLELGHLDWNLAREAIKQPIYKYYNKEVSPEEPFAIEDEDRLIEKVLEEVSQRNNHKDRIEAPYLQLVMESLWKKEIDTGSRSLRLQTFTELGGAAGIAERHLNEKMELLSKNERDLEIAASVFHYLVTPSGGKHAYRAFDLASLVNREQRKGDRTELVTENELNPWLDKLTQRDFRILRPVGKSPNLSYEIFHDVLAQPILAWLAEYLKKKEEEKAKQEAEHIRQEAEKIAEKKIEDARQEAQQKIQAADLKVSQAELEVEAAKQKAKWWGLGGLGIAGIFLLLGIVGIRVVVTQLGQILAINNKLFESQRFMNSEQSIKQNQQQLVASLVKGGDQLKKQQWFLALIQQNLAQQSNLMGLLASALFNEKNPETIIYEGDGKSAWAVSFSPNEKQLVTGSEDGSIRLWDLQTQKPSVRVISPGDGKLVWAVNFSPDGRQLATGSDDGKIRLWDLQTQTPQEKILSPGDKNAVLSMSFSRDRKQKQLVTGSADGKIRLWDLQTQTPQEKILSPGDKNAVLSMSFSPDGQQLATGSADGKISLWSWQDKSPQEKILFPGDKNAVLSMSFSSNGKEQLSTASFNGIVRLWDLQSQPKEQRPIISLLPGECLLTISFNRDGRQFAVVSGKQEETGSRCIQEQISLFDQQGNQRIYNYLIKKDSPITRITFSPNGKQLATVSENGAVKIWPIYTFDELLDMGQTWVCTHSQDPEVIKDISCPNKTNSS